MAIGAGEPESVDLVQMFDVDMLVVDVLVVEAVVAKLSGGELLELRLLDKKWNRSFFICRTCINI